MDLVQQILQISARLEKKTLVSQTLLAQKNYKHSDSTQKKFIDRCEGKTAAENKSSEVGKNMFLGQRGMVELS